MTGWRDRDSDARESLTEQEIVVAGLVGRYVERRERGEAPCADDLSAVAAEFGADAVEQLRRALAFYEAMRASEPGAR